MVNIARMREAAHRSILLSQVTETMESLSTIWAYGVVDRFLRHFCREADASVRAYATFNTCYRFIRLVSAVCGFAIVLVALFSMIIGVREGSMSNPGDIGLILTAASSVRGFTLSFCS